MRKRDAGSREGLLDVTFELGDIAEGGDLDGPSYAGGAQGRRDSRGHAAGVTVGRNLAPMEVPPHRNLHRLALFLLLLVPPPPLAAAIGRAPAGGMRAESANPLNTKEEEGVAAARKRSGHSCDHRRRLPLRRHGQLEAVALGFLCLSSLQGLKAEGKSSVGSPLMGLKRAGQYRLKRSR